MEPKHIQRREEIKINEFNAEALNQSGLSATCVDNTVMPIVHNNVKIFPGEVVHSAKHATSEDASQLCLKDSLNNDFHAPCMSCKEITNHYHRLPTCTREQGSQLKYVPNPAKFSSACQPSTTARECGIDNDPNCSKHHTKLAFEEQIPEYGILQRHSAAEGNIDGIKSRVARYAESDSQECAEISRTYSHLNAHTNPQIHNGVQNNNGNLEVRQQFHRDSNVCENTDGLNSAVKTCYNVNRHSVCTFSHYSLPTNRHNHNDVQYNNDNLEVQQQIFRKPNICGNTDDINSTVKTCYNGSRASNNYECSNRYSGLSPGNTSDQMLCTYFEKQTENLQKQNKDFGKLKMKYSNLKILVITLVIINILVFALMLVHFIVNKCSCEVSDEKVTEIVSKQLTPIEIMMNNHNQVIKDVENTIKAQVDMQKYGIFHNSSQNINGSIYAELHSKVLDHGYLINEIFTRQVPAIKLISTSLRDNKHPLWSVEIHSGKDKIEYINDNRVLLKERGIYFVYCTLRFKGHCGNEKTIRFDMKNGHEQKIVGIARSDCQDDKHFDKDLTIQSLINITKNDNFLFIHMESFSLEQLERNGPFFWWIFKL